ncbi:hypothetical protein [Variovorax sp. IB41]|uniref:hypothetical protein n=1 Tax=Variovorax sp. IB41 TaxID=2779370 RepID=UPI0018E7650D|nr:hypothetical protein [Variovorax sp. IB41]MBJ2157146.1 hypothetical protein [Variovorax sp. IB41]
MATKKSSKTPTKTSGTAESVHTTPQPPAEKDFLDAERRDVIRIASCEALDWLTILQSLSESDTFDPPTLTRRLPGILKWLEELNGIVLSAIDDPSDETASLRRRLGQGGAM